MNYCKKCGVELDSDMEFCPLCGLKSGEEPIYINQPKEKPSDFKVKMLNEIKQLSVTQKLKLFWKISGIILLAGIIITVTINLIVNHNVSWAKYNLIASMTLFAHISFVLLFRKRTFSLIISSLISLIVMFFTIDYYSVDSNWGVKLGIPIITSVYILLIAILALIRISNQIGFNILAIVFMAIALQLLSIEISVSSYLHQTIILNWSIITGASLMPISGLLFIVHYKLKKGIELKRFFHI